VGKVSYTHYDAVGRITATIGPRGKVTYYSYDILGRQTEVIDSAGDDYETEYDAAGNRIATADVTVARMDAPARRLDEWRPGSTRTSSAHTHPRAVLPDADRARPQERV
jgi:YD repeat-containing protein